jgi:hypothetical protein
MECEGMHNMDIKNDYIKIVKKIIDDDETNRSHDKKEIKDLSEK